MIYSPEQIKRAIEDFEFYNNGFDKLNSVSVSCERINEIDDDDTENIIIFADVNVYFDADGKKESYSNANYPLRLLRRWIIE